LKAIDHFESEQHAFVKFEHQADELTAENKVSAAVLLQLCHSLMKCQCVTVLQQQDEVW